MNVIHKIREKFMNISIREKMILSYFVIALIPFSIWAVISIGIFTTQVEETITEHTNQMIGQVRSNLDAYINSLEKVSNYILKEVEDVAFFDMRSEDDIFWQFESDKISSMMFNIAETHPEAAGILIATENDMYISTGMTRISRDSFKEEEWYKSAVESPSEVQVISNGTGRNIVTNAGYSADDVFSLSKAIVNPDTGDVEGVILMDIRHDIISKSVENIKIGEKGFVFVVDEDLNMVYTPVNDIAYRVDPAWLTDSSKPVTVKINGENYHIRYEISNYTGWKIIGVFSKDEIMMNRNSMVYILLGFVLVIFTGIVIATVETSRTITDPILKLSEAMKAAESGNLKVRFDVRYADEVNNLGNNFNHLLDRVEELIDMVYAEQKNKQTAQLKALQEQIKPHFLYNTLDTISWMAREYEAADIVRLVDALTNLFRIGLSQGKDYISIKEEIGYVSNYLYIQKIRYSSKLNYQIIDDERIKDVEVPKLILQPLVENAIYHGIKAKRTEGHIIIVTEILDAKNIRFTVEDDGSGMTQDKVNELNERLNQPSVLQASQSFGLFYVKERLRLRYGDRFEVKVVSALDIGTKVSIVIPFEEGQYEQISL